MNIMDLGRNYEGGTQIARKLKPAIAELEHVGFLEALPETERFSKRGRDWTIRLVQKPAPLPAPPDGIPGSEAVPHPLVAELVKRGVHEEMAAELVDQHATQKIQAKIEEFNWLVERKDKRVAKNPAGFLIKSITTGINGYKTPVGFVSQAERERQVEAKRQADDAANEERRRKQEIDREEAPVGRSSEGLSPVADAGAARTARSRRHHPGQRGTTANPGRSGDESLPQDSDYRADQRAYRPSHPVRPTGGRIGLAALPHICRYNASNHFADFASLK